MYNFCIQQLKIFFFLQIVCGLMMIKFFFINKILNI